MYLTLVLFCVQAICQTIHELHSLLDYSTDIVCHSGKQILVVGCAHDEFLVHAKVRDIFPDKVHFPLPSARERRRLMRTAWEEHQQHVCISQGAYPASQLDITADSSAGLTVIPLICAFRETVRIKALQLQCTMQSLASGDSGGGVVSLSAAPPFAQVAGLEDVKRVLQEAVLWPRQYAHLFRAFTARYDPSGRDQMQSAESGETAGTVGLCAGILLFGPPGIHLCPVVCLSAFINFMYELFYCLKALGKLFCRAPCRRNWGAVWSICGSATWCAGRSEPARSAWCSSFKKLNAALRASFSSTNSKRCLPPGLPGKVTMQVAAVSQPRWRVALTT